MNQRVFRLSSWFNQIFILISFHLFIYLFVHPGSSAYCVIDSGHLMQASHNPKVSFHKLPYYLFSYVFSLHFGVEFKCLCKYIKRVMIAFSIALRDRWLEKSGKRGHSLPLKNGATLSAYLTPCDGFYYCS